MSKHKDNLLTVLYKRIRGKKTKGEERYVLSEYDPGLIEELAEKKLTIYMKLMKDEGFKISDYGNIEKKNYFKKLFVVEEMNRICSMNGWLKKKHWLDKKVPYLENLAELTGSLVPYSEILMHYFKKHNEEVKENHG